MDADANGTFVSNLWLTIWWIAEDFLASAIGDENAILPHIIYL